MDYTFATPQSDFSIRGIDIAANLDPDNPTAFVTGVTFNSTGVVNVTQTPIRSGSTSVPGPLPLLGFFAAYRYSRTLQKRIKSSKPEVFSTIAV